MGTHRDVYEDSNMNPKPTTMASIVANRAVGGKTKFNQLSAAKKKQAIEDDGPNVNSKFTLESIPEESRTGRKSEPVLGESKLERRPDTKRQKRKSEEKVSEEEFENMVSKREKTIQDEIRLRNLQKSDTEKSKLETEKMLFKSINQNDTTPIPMELD